MASNGWKPIRSLDGLSLAGIYALKHKPSGRVLVCGSTNVYKRLWDDIKALNNGDHYNVALRRDLMADGPQAFEWWLVQEVGVPDLLKLLKAYHVAEMARKGLSYNVKPAVPKHRRSVQPAEAVVVDPVPSLLRPRETLKAKERRLMKALFDGLPSADKDMIARADQLLERVARLRESGWAV